jgi:hypothetical protein
MVFNLQTFNGKQDLLDTPCSYLGQVYIAFRRPKIKLSFLLLSLLSLLTSLVSAASPTYYGMHLLSFDGKVKLITSIQQSKSKMLKGGNSIPVAQEHRHSRPMVLASLSRIK